VGAGDVRLGLGDGEALADGLGLRLGDGEALGDGLGLRLGDDEAVGDALVLVAEVGLGAGAGVLGRLLSTNQAPRPRIASNSITQTVTNTGTTELGGCAQASSTGSSANSGRGAVGTGTCARAAHRGVGAGASGCAGITLVPLGPSGGGLGTRGAAGGTTVGAPTHGSIGPVTAVLSGARGLAWVSASSTGGALDPASPAGGPKPGAGGASRAGVFSSLVPTFGRDHCSTPFLALARIDRRQPPVRPSTRLQPSRDQLPTRTSPSSKAPR
jgi:hypothetical protein